MGQTKSGRLLCLRYLGSNTLSHRHPKCCGFCHFLFAVFVHVWIVEPLTAASSRRLRGRHTASQVIANSHIRISAHKEQPDRLTLTDYVAETGEC